MDLVSPAEHFCYVRCTYCNTVLAVEVPCKRILLQNYLTSFPWLQVGVPCKRMMDIVTGKCGHCNSLSFLSPRPIQQNLSLTEHPISQLQGPCSDCLRVSSLSWFSGEPTIQKLPFVVKPPEKKHRMPSAYNLFMKEEILRIKAVQPDIPHREAFSKAAKNWAKCDPRCSTMASTSESKKLAPISELERNKNNTRTESSKVHNHREKKD